MLSNKTENRFLELTKLQLKFGKVYFKTLKIQKQTNRVVQNLSYKILVLSTVFTEIVSTINLIWISLINKDTKMIYFLNRKKCASF